MTIKEAEIYAKDKLKFHYDKKEISGLLRIIFEDAFEINQIKLIADAKEKFGEINFLRLKKILNRLKNSEPIQHIIGFTYFYEYKFFVNKNVLIPRWETEELVELILNDFAKTDKKIRIIDIGTGSACIAVSLAKNLENSDIYALDISRKALETASENAKINKVKINFVQKNILKHQQINFKNKFDIIVSNPPYVKNSEKKTLQKQVVEYEPNNAIFVPDENHLCFYIAISDFALNNLTKKGKLYVEINEKHGNEIVKLFKNKGFENIKLIKDINEKNRFVSCNKTI